MTKKLEVIFPKLQHAHYRITSPPERRYNCITDTPPENGYELSVRDGRISNGKFYLLDPNEPHDLKHAGQTVAFEDIKVSEKEITFSITLQSNPKEYRHRLTISFLERLS